MRMICPDCGHDVGSTRPVRSVLDWLLRRAPHLECVVVDEDDVGNGWAGFGACGCRAAAHA